jgi:hypothetical protein
VSRLWVTRLTCGGLASREFEGREPGDFAARFAKSRHCECRSWADSGVTSDLVFLPSSGASVLPLPRSVRLASAPSALSLSVISDMTRHHSGSSRVLLNSTIATELKTSFTTRRHSLAEMRRLPFEMQRLRKVPWALQRLHRPVNNGVADPKIRLLDQNTAVVFLC